MSREVSNPLWEILVPCEWRGGTPVRTRHHRQWDQYVMRRTGGLTIFKPSKGKWVSPKDDRVDDERMIPVRIACDEATIREIARFTLQHYEQEAVFYYQVTDYAVIMFDEED